jgi:hypothetical protein
LSGGGALRHERALQDAPERLRARGAQHNKKNGGGKRLHDSGREGGGAGAKRDREGDLVVIGSAKAIQNTGSAAKFMTTEERKSSFSARKSTKPPTATPKKHTRRAKRFPKNRRETGEVYLHGKNSYLCVHNSYENMMKKVLEIACFIAIACLLTACGGKNQHFTIDGSLAGGADRMLYLENVGIAKIVVIDSLRLTSDQFRFKRQRPDYPDFYRLRLGRQVINLAVDSTETIHITADTARFAKDYVLEGDVVQSQELKELTLLQNNTSLQYSKLQKQYETGQVTVDQYLALSDSVVDAYKTAAREYIFRDFLSLTAYFALFQQINNLFIFDIYDKDDNKLFGAVANSWNTVYPESPRSLQMKKMFTGSRVVLRQEQQTIDVQEADAKQMFDIALPSMDNKPLRLSEIGEGRVTLIDFTVYAGAFSPTHNLLLAELYDRYRAKGMTIYQISLDADNHLWKNAAVNLPWYCVRDPETVYSSVAQAYNVINIPTAFIRDRSGEIVARVEDYGALEATLSKYLK